MTIEPGHDQEYRQSIIDAEHLDLLAIGYYVSAAISACFSMLGFLYMAIGLVMVVVFRKAVAQAVRPQNAPPEFLGWIFAGIGLAVFLLLLTMAWLKYRAGRCLKRRRSRIFCMVMAGISCLELPYGAVLGVFTFIVFERASVKRLFEDSGIPPPPIHG
jgi:hypothetical protein